MESRFDALAKSLAQSSSRRDALRRLGGFAAAAALTAVGISCAPDDMVGPDSKATNPLFARGRCKKQGQRCRENDECCSDVCDPLTGYCACAAGTTTCPASGQCVPVCGTFEVLNPETCRCECGALSEQCGTTCCAPGLKCCGGSCVDTATNANNCGNCGTICNTTIAGEQFDQVCANGTCGCLTGSEPCSGPIFGNFCCPAPYRCAGQGTDACI